MAALMARSWAENRPSTDLVVVVDDPGANIGRERRRFEGKEFVTTLVSKRLLESDVRRGTLGEFVASSLFEPYTPLIGSEYLVEQETDLKMRIIKEEIENLALRFKDLLLDILIDPKFFFHAKMQRRAKIYPPLRSVYRRFLVEGNHDSAYGFEKALDRMSKSDLLVVNEHVRVTRKLLDDLPKPGQIAFTPFREVERAIRRLATYGVANNPLDSPLVDDLSQHLDEVSADVFQDLPDPKAYLFLHTGRGLVPMDDGRSYRELISEDGMDTGPPRSIRRIGGALNFVYLVEYVQGGRRKRVIAKTYQNWYGLKWIPLSLWTIGSQNFDIIGERRLSNEYRMNRSLRSHGLNAPEIYHVSMPRLTIIEEFIAGRGFDNITRRCLARSEDDLLAAIGHLGEEISKIHDVGITLGDSKPDNAILDEKGKIWFVDLEQASEGGNPSWDLAEFLYYSGHYSLRWQRVKYLSTVFLEGYLKAGRKDVVREISSSKYKRIFGVMTAPHIVMGISNLCRDYGRSS